SERAARLLIDTLRAMRRAVGDDFVVGVRLKAHELHPEGLDVPDFVAIIHLLTAERLIDYVSLTVGVREAHTGTMDRPDGEYLPLVATIRNQVDVPVMHAGRIRDPFLAEQALATGQVDLVGMTKAHFADAHFVNKGRAGHLGDTRCCLGCQYCGGGGEGAVSCLYTPVTRGEGGGAIVRPAAVPNRGVGGGAGPAGMEAAMVLSERGHVVTV